MNAMPDMPSRECQETVRSLLEASGRKKPEVPLRHEFVEQGPQRSPKPGPVREIVRHHDDRALDLYLLLRAAASSEPWDVTRDARI